MLPIILNDPVHKIIIIIINKTIFLHILVLVTANQYSAMASAGDP